MMSTGSTLKQVYDPTRNVLEAARERIAGVFDDYESICVSISGGKDSTVLAHLAGAEAKRRGRKIDVFFLDEENPVLSVAISMAEGGEITLSTDAAGKTVLAVEDAMSDESGEAVQGLLGDVMANGLGELMGVAMEAVPEIGSLLGMFMGGADMAS